MRATNRAMLIAPGLLFLSLTVAAGEDRLVHALVIDGSVDEVWMAFTTKKGIESWMVPVAEIELKVGGKMRTSYDATSTLRDGKTIENTILSFDPKRMLSIKATKPPEGFPFAEAIKSMWTVIYFDELGPKQTRVTVVGLGYGTDEESKKLREHFDKGNAFTLEQLRKRFALK